MNALMKLKKLLREKMKTFNYISFILLFFANTNCSTLSNKYFNKTKKQTFKIGKHAKYNFKSKIFYAQYMDKHLREEYWDKKAERKQKQIILTIYSKSGYGCEIYRAEKECGISDSNFCKRYKNIRTCWNKQKQCEEEAQKECRKRFPK